MFLNLNLDKSKVSFFQIFWSLLALENQIITHLLASFHSIFGRTDLSFIQVEKSKKGVSTNFSNDFEQNVSF